LATAGRLRRGRAGWLTAVAAAGGLEPPAAATVAGAVLRRRLEAPAGGGGRQALVGDERLAEVDRDGQPAGAGQDLEPAGPGRPAPADEVGVGTRSRPQRDEGQDPHTQHGRGTATPRSSGAVDD